MKREGYPLTLLRFKLFMISTPKNTEGTAFLPGTGRVLQMIHPYIPYIAVHPTQLLSIHNKRGDLRLTFSPNGVSHSNKIWTP